MTEEATFTRHNFFFTSSELSAIQSSASIMFFFLIGCALFDFSTKKRQKSITYEKKIHQLLQCVAFHLLLANIFMAVDMLY